MKKRFLIILLSVLSVFLYACINSPTSNQEALCVICDNNIVENEAENGTLILSGKIKNMGPNQALRVQITFTIQIKDTASSYFYPKISVYTDPPRLLVNEVGKFTCFTQIKKEEIWGYSYKITWE